MTENNSSLVWHKVLSKDELPEGRVTAVTCKNRTLCMSRDLDAAFDKALSHTGPALVEVMTDAELV